MDKLLSFSSELAKINNEFNITSDTLSLLQVKIKSEKVKLPIIGKFSVGKSALMNTLLGYSRNLLKEDVSPETAIPTELIYDTKDAIFTVNLNNDEAMITPSQFIKTEFNVNEFKSVRLKLKNEKFLRHIPDVMLVDMPGFESGIEVHNKAIDHYLPDSHSYLIAFQADDMILRESMIGILKELSLHNIPIAVVITKCDKVTEQALQANEVHLKKELSKYFSNYDEIEFIYTSSKTNDIKLLSHYLEKIQNQSEKILYSRFSQLFKQEMYLTKSYLESLNKNMSLNESELEIRLDRLIANIKDLDESLNDTSSNLINELPILVKSVTGDVSIALQYEKNSLASMIINNVDIKDKVNSIIRESITKSLQKRFIPRVEKYIKEVQNITQSINIDFLADFSKQLAVDTNSLTKNIVTGVLATVSLIFFGPLMTIIASFVHIFIGKQAKEKKMLEQKNEVLQKLHTEVYPSILTEIELTLSQQLRLQVDEINQNVTSELIKQKEVLQQSFDKVKNELHAENQEKEALLQQITSTLIRIEDMVNEL